MTEIIGAVSIAGLSTAISALLVSAVGLGLLFLGYRYAKKTMNKA